MKIFLATDHAGYTLKEAIKSWLVEAGHSVEDCGALEFNPADDYPQFMSAAAAKLKQSKSKDSRAILFGGSGQGEAIVANRSTGVRAVVLYSYDEGIIRLSREHNDANALSIGARFLSEVDAKKAIGLWLATPFSGEDRHKRRIDAIDS